MHKNCPNEQFLVFMMGVIASLGSYRLWLGSYRLRLGSYRFAWELSLRLEVMRLCREVKRTIEMINEKSYVLPRSGIIFAA